MAVFSVVCGFVQCTDNTNNEETNPHSGGGAGELVSGLQQQFVLWMESEENLFSRAAGMDEVCRKRQLLENQQNRGIIEQSFFFGGIIVEVIKDKINKKTSSEVCKELQNYSVRAGKTKFRRRKAHTASYSNSRNWGRSARVFHQRSWLKRCAISKLSAARTVFSVESAIVAPTLSVPNWLFLPSFNSVLFIFVVKAFVCYIFFTKWKRIHFSGSKLFYIPGVSAATFFSHVRLGK